MPKKQFKSNFLNNLSSLGIEVVVHKDLKPLLIKEKNTLQQYADIQDNLPITEMDKTFNTKRFYKLNKEIIKPAVWKVVWVVEPRSYLYTHTKQSLQKLALEEFCKNIIQIEPEPYDETDELAEELELLDLNTKSLPFTDNDNREMTKLKNKIYKLRRKIKDNTLTDEGWVGGNLLGHLQSENLKEILNKITHNRKYKIMEYSLEDMLNDFKQIKILT